MDLQKNIGERVSLISGKKPIILICPHGYRGDDKNTALITEYIARKINCYAVINRGWERHDFVDSSLDKADCNNVYHCNQDVVREEFLDPILRFVSRTLKKNPFIYVFYLHGMSNFHRIKSGIYDLDIVIGCGADDPNFFSCSLWRKDLFCFCLSRSGFVVAEGTPKSKLCGSAKQNMNQFFVQWRPNLLVQSMQLEIVENRRKSQISSEKTAELLSLSFLRLLESDNFYSDAKMLSY